jgi:putative peptidoglycan lipid II flippase
LRAAFEAVFVSTLVLAGAYIAVLMTIRQQDLATWLGFVPIVVVIPVSAALAAHLVADHRYPLAALRLPLATAIGLGLALLALAVTDRIVYVALAVSAGQLIALFVLILCTRAALRETHIRYAPAFAALGAAGPVLVAVLLSGLTFVVTERLLAVSLEAGSITVLAVAHGFALVPLMIAFALGNGLLPSAAESHRRGDHHALVRSSRITFRFGVLTSLVAMAFLVIAREDVVEVTFEHGAFQAESASATARLVAIFALALPGLSASAIASRGLFGIGAQRPVAQVSALVFAAYIPLALALRAKFGIDGLAAAFSLVSFAGGCVITALFAVRLRLSKASILRGWMLSPAVPALAFAVGAWTGWRLATWGSSPALTTIAVVLLVGGIFLLIAVAAAHGPERDVIEQGARHVLSRVQDGWR